MGKRKYQNADQLRNAAKSYFTWCDNNPIRGARVVKTKKATDKNIGDELLPRPYTFEGLSLHIGINDYLQFVRDNKEREGFAEVFAWIKNTIRDNQISGGMVGIYNPNLTARLNGIAEQMQTTEIPAPQFLQDEDE